MSKPPSEPAHGRLGIFDGVATQFMRTRNHHNRNSKTARSFDFRVGRRAARILGDEHIDLLALEQHRLRLWIEGTAPSQQLDVGRQRDIIRRVDRACDHPPGRVKMLP